MLSSTVENMACMPERSSSSSTMLLKRPWPMRRVHKIAVAYSVMTMNTSTQNMPCNASMTPIASSKSGRTIRTKRKRRTMRSNRHIRISMKTTLIWLPFLCHSAFKRLIKGMSHVSETPLMTMLKSKRFQTHSSSCWKKLNPFLTNLAKSSRTKKASSSCSMYHQRGLAMSVSKPMINAFTKITSPLKPWNQSDSTHAIGPVTTTSAGSSSVLYLDRFKPWRLDCIVGIALAASRSSSTSLRINV
mmetsp:Transcript_82488/g.229991  ORF Transcript_82488/g.229991 Transcript_82488/m.229991 type:complete len:245 (-) Transcript_82488:377-1111(-)